MLTIVFIFNIITIALLLVVLFVPKKQGSNAELENKLFEIEGNLNRMNSSLKEDFKINREESTKNASANRNELNESLKSMRFELMQSIEKMSEVNKNALEKLNKTLEEKIIQLIDKNDISNRSNRDELSKSLKDFQSSFDKNVESFNNLQREKFSQLEIKQNELLTNTENKLEQMRVIVDEKLQKTLNERLGHSFEMVSKQLSDVQKGLGEMQILSQDVGGLKKILSNVKTRGGFGEVQLEMILEQLMSPEQYIKNAKTKANSNDLVEFAIKLPGRDDSSSVVYLPIDAKFPSETYQNLVDAYETFDQVQIDAKGKELENVLKKMAKDIRDKYLDPPYTTDFGIMFLPFESLYAEIARRSNLLEILQREYKVIVTGPTTFGAILNSLQMGFRTLALQKRSSEVWNILGGVKTEFQKFGDLLAKAQKNINQASSNIDDLIGTRTAAINRKLREVAMMPQLESGKLPENEIIEEEEQSI